MQKITINFPINKCNSDEFDSWTLLRAPDEKGQLNDVLTITAHCREFFLSDIAANILYDKNKKTITDALLGKEGWSYLAVSIVSYEDDLLELYFDKHEDEDWYQKNNEKLRQLLCLKEHRIHNRRLKKALKLLNHFERLAGWKKSRMVGGPIYNKGKSRKWYRDAIWVIRVTKEWFVSPHMLSMCILIMRSGLYYENNDIIKFASDKRFKMVSIRDIKDNLMLKDGPWELPSRIDESGKYWIAILKNYSRIFRYDSKDPLKYWRNTRSGEGITSLVESNTDHYDLAMKMDVLLTKGKLTSDDLKQICKKGKEKWW